MGVSDRVREIIAVAAGRSEPPGDDLHLYDDLEFDSLSVISLWSLIEEEFDLSFSEDQFLPARTVSEVIRLVEAA